MISSRSVLSDIDGWPILRFESMAAAHRRATRGVLQVHQRLVDTTADHLVKVVADLVPAGALRHVERVVEGRCLGSLLCLPLGAATSQQVGDHLLLLGLELVRGVLQNSIPKMYSL
jgi:hypothetical protein